tara:strand:+ start:681 stop:1730 length:1050 start_codon:yes stop_codon:yes gene_type:complete
VPAKTTEQLFATHSQYLDGSASEQEDFRNALNEVMPRIYKMGYWREMLVEHTQDASDGYVSLPQDTDSIVAGILDDNPLPVRSLWHDYKMLGTNSQDDTLLGAFIDDGYAPTYRDLVSGSKYKIQYHTLKGLNFDTEPSVGNVIIKYRKHEDGTGSGSTALIGDATKLEGASYNEATKTFAGASQSTSVDMIIHQDVTDILSITWVGFEEDHPIQITAKYNGVAGGSTSSDSTKDLLLAQVNSANGSSRYRRFRIGGTNATSSAHMLLKRKWVDVDSTTDLVHMPSNSLLKHALLGKLAEDNADLERAQYHWGTVSQLLEEDTDSYRGAAKPTLKISPNGVGGSVLGMY